MAEGTARRRSPRWAPPLSAAPGYAQLAGSQVLSTAVTRVPVLLPHRFRESGLGGDDGKHGLDGFLRKKTVYLNYAKAARDAAGRQR